MLHQPEPHGLTFSALIADVERGSIKIPQFQRDFVWSREKSAKLLDSILKGYPIGTFILWKTRIPLRFVRNIGGATLPDTPEGDFVQHVLDGQQRLTSLYASVKGLKVVREGRTDDFAELYVNLKAVGEEDAVTVGADDLDPADSIRIVDLLNADFSVLAAYPKEYHPILSEYQSRLKTYQFSVVLVREAPLEVATEIFTRINVTGKALSVFEIMVAKTFDSSKGFDLAEKYDNLQTALAHVDYDSLSPSVILQSVAMILEGECTKKHILGLSKADFIEVWPEAVDAILSAVDYFRNYYRIPVSNLLPFGSLIVPFTYYFYFHRDKPTGVAQQLLQDFFWRTSLGTRYSHSVESHLAQDIRRIDRILKAEAPDYDYPVDTSAEFVRANGAFSTSRSYIKSILCLLAYHEPKSFVDGSIVRISNDHLKQANSKNYHHFFPRAYLRRLGVADELANHIANITIVDDFLNKREIRDKPPGTYMPEFVRKNPKIESTMATHLINLHGFGIWENDYSTFLDARCRAIADALRERIIPQNVDRFGQAPRFDDFDEPEVAAM